MGLPLPLATCLSWVGPPSNLGGTSHTHPVRGVLLFIFKSQVSQNNPPFWCLVRVVRAAGRRQKAPQAAGRRAN